MSDPQRVALITGAASGIGRAAAFAFAKAGCKVVAADIDEHGVQETCSQMAAAGLQAIPVQVDISNEDSVRSMIDTISATYGQLHYAFNNAGIEGSEVKPLHELSTDSFDQVLLVNLRGTFLCMKYQIPLMLQTGEDPAILLTSSICGLKGLPGYASYTATKHGIIGMTKVAARDYGGRIRVNAICPGFVDTPMQARAMARLPEEVVKAMPPPEKNIPIKRKCAAEEIADMAVFLCMQARYMTGESVVVDGGLIC